MDFLSCSGRRALGIFLVFCFIGIEVSYGAPYGVDASASTHVAHINGTTAGGWVRGGATALKVGAGANAGQHGLGFGAEATLAEAGGKVGQGAMSIGGKVGLSASSGFDFGPRKTGFKVIGTGVSIGTENGFEICFFGSCVSIG